MNSSAIDAEDSFHEGIACIAAGAMSFPCLLAFCSGMGEGSIIFPCMALIVGVIMGIDMLVHSARLNGFFSKDRHGRASLISGYMKDVPEYARLAAWYSLFTTAFVAAFATLAYFVALGFLRI